MTEPVFPTRPRRLPLWLSLRQLALMMMSLILRATRGREERMQLLFRRATTQGFFPHLGTGKNPLEVSTKALHKKARFQWSFHQLRETNTIIYVFTPELQN